MPLSTTVMPASNRAGYLLSRSRIRCFTRHRGSSRFIIRLRAAWVIQAAVGCVVAPRMRMRRLAWSMTARTYMRVPVRVIVSMKSAASSASAVRWIS